MGRFQGSSCGTCPNRILFCGNRRGSCADSGRAVALDTTPPRPGLFAPLAKLYLRYGIPLLGRLLARNPSDYQYLQHSTVTFLSAEALAEKLERAGFEAVEFATRMFGTVAILKGKR